MANHPTSVLGGSQFQVMLIFRREINGSSAEP